MKHLPVLTLLALICLAVLPGVAENKKSSKLKAVAPKTEPQKNENAEKPREPMSSGTFDGLKLRSIGPAMISGRIVALAVDPRNRARYYVGTASGGLWKTENDGTSWTPVFEHEGSYSIGAVKLDPNNPDVVWVGTGESNSQRSVAYGDGVYRSDDGGKNWQNLGLKRSEHIIPLQLPEDEYAQLSALAAARKKSVPDIIRHLIERSLKEIRTNPSARL